MGKYDTKNKNILFMKAVSKDIINAFNKKNTGELTLDQINKKFYRIMIKHGIKKGTKTDNGNGTTCNNFEWTMCKTLFDKIVADENNFRDLNTYTRKTVLNK
jgi:hypothetical protein